MNQPFPLINHPLTIGRFFSLSIALYKRFFFQSLLLGLILTVPNLLISLFITDTEVLNSENDAFLFIFNEIVLLLLWTYGMIIIFDACRQACLGVALNWKAALKGGHQNLVKVLGAYIVTGLWVLLMSLLLVIPGIFAAINCLLVVPVMLIDGKPLGKSWEESKILIDGFEWRALLVLTLVSILPVLVEFLISFLAMIFGGEEILTIAEPWIPYAASALCLSITPIFCTLFYYDMRLRKDSQIDTSVETTPAIAT